MVTPHKGKLPQMKEGRNSTMDKTTIVEKKEDIPAKKVTILEGGMERGSNLKLPILRSGTKEQEPRSCKASSRLKRIFNRGQHV